MQTLVLVGTLQVRVRLQLAHLQEDLLHAPISLSHLGSSSLRHSCSMHVLASYDLAAQTFEVSLPALDCCRRLGIDGMHEQPPGGFPLDASSSWP